MEGKIGSFYRQNINERILPTSITEEGKQLFFELFGVTFEQAKELATWEGEVGKYWKGYIYLSQGGICQKH
jgi:hypothetical protein